MRMLRKGDIITGVISNIRPYGVFIKIDEQITGILYKEEISSTFVKELSHTFKIGEKVKAVVKKFDVDTGKLTLSSKKNYFSWEELISTIKENEIAVGTVGRRYKSGVFIELKPNLYGFADFKNEVSSGDKVNVLIKRISPETKKIKLEILD